MPKTQEPESVAYPGFPAFSSASMGMGSLNRGFDVLPVANENALLVKRGCGYLTYTYANHLPGNWQGGWGENVEGTLPQPECKPRIQRREESYSPTSPPQPEQEFSPVFSGRSPTSPNTPFNPSPRDLDDYTLSINRLSSPIYGESPVAPNYSPYYGYCGKSPVAPNYSPYSPKGYTLDSFIQDASAASPDYGPRSRASLPPSPTYAPASPAMYGYGYRAFGPPPSPEHERPSSLGSSTLRPSPPPLEHDLSSPVPDLHSSSPRHAPESPSYAPLSPQVFHQASPLWDVRGIDSRPVSGGLRQLERPEDYRLNGQTLPWLKPYGTTANHLHSQAQWPSYHGMQATETTEEPRASSRSSTKRPRGNSFGEILQPHVKRRRRCSCITGDPANPRITRYEDGEVLRYGAGESYRPFNRDRDRSPRRPRSPLRDRERDRDRDHRGRTPPVTSDSYVPNRSPRRRSRSPDRYRAPDRARDTGGESWRRRDSSRGRIRSPVRRLSPRRSPRRSPNRYSPAPRRDDRFDRARSPRRDFDRLDSLLTTFPPTRFCKPTQRQQHHNPPWRAGIGNSIHAHTYPSIGAALDHRSTATAVTVLVRRLDAHLHLLVAAHRIDRGRAPLIAVMTDTAQA